MMLNITQVSGLNPFTTKPSGMYAHIAGLAANISKRGAEVTLISTEIGKEELNKYRIEHISIKMKKVSSIVFMVKLMIKTPFFRIPKNSIIHTHRPDFMLPFIIFYPKNPKVCTLHGNPDIGVKARKHYPIWRIYNIIESFSLPHIDRLIAVNQATKEYYREKELKIGHKIDVIPVGIDTKLFKPLNKEAVRKKYKFEMQDIIVLFIGRFSKEKGLDMLLEVYNRLNINQKKIKLVLVGEGPDKEKLENTIRTQKIEGVTFIEPLPHDKIPEIINCADVLALSSSYEGMPTVVLEALACGVPVVSTDVGDVKNVVVNGKTGFVIKKRVVGAFRDALAEVIGNGREYYSKDCAEMSQNYSWDNITEKIMNVYSELTSNE
jgi:glycosyltransferase involved in cell wall biosynthesis